MWAAPSPMVDPTERTPKQSTLTAAPVIKSASYRLDRQLVGVRLPQWLRPGETVALAGWTAHGSRPPQGPGGGSIAFATLLEGCGIGARTGCLPTGLRHNGDSPVPECSLWLGPRRQGAMSSASGTG